MGYAVSDSVVASHRIPFILPSSHLLLEIVTTRNCTVYFLLHGFVVPQTDYYYSYAVICKAEFGRFI
jgi:hypothetical protein